jgi:hypothetical protein
LETEVRAYDDSVPVTIKRENLENPPGGTYTTITFGVFQDSGFGGEITGRRNIKSYASAPGCSITYRVEQDAGGYPTRLMIVQGPL